jgi:hypothetical protein
LTVKRGGLKSGAERKEYVAAAAAVAGAARAESMSVAAVSRTVYSFIFPPRHPTDRGNVREKEDGVRR